MELLNSGAAQCSEVDALLVDGGVKSECVVTDEESGVLEIKNNGA